MRKSPAERPVCTMKPSKWHERWLEVLARATSSTHKSTLSSMVCHQLEKVEFSAPGLLGLDEAVAKETQKRSTQSVRNSLGSLDNAHNQQRGFHVFNVGDGTPVGERLG